MPMTTDMSSSADYPPYAQFVPNELLIGTRAEQVAATINYLRRECMPYQAIHDVYSSIEYGNNYGYWMANPGDGVKQTICRYRIFRPTGAGLSSRYTWRCEAAKNTAGVGGDNPNIIVSIGGVESAVPITVTDDWQPLEYNAAAVDGGAGWYEILVRVEGYNDGGAGAKIYLKAFGLAYYPEASLIDMGGANDQNQSEYWLDRHGWTDDSPITAATMSQAISALYEWWQYHWLAEPILTYSDDEGFITGGKGGVPSVTAPVGTAGLWPHLDSGATHYRAFDLYWQVPPGIYWIYASVWGELVGVATDCNIVLCTTTDPGIAASSWTTTDGAWVGLHARVTPGRQERIQVLCSADGAGGGVWLRNCCIVPNISFSRGWAS